MQVLKKYLQKRANYLHNLHNQDLFSLRLYRSFEPSQEQIIVFHAYALFSRYFKIGFPGETRTPNPHIRSVMPYPIRLRGNILVGRVGFEPTKQNADDLQSPPFSQTWIPTHIKSNIIWFFSSAMLTKHSRILSTAIWTEPVFTLGNVLCLLSVNSPDCTHPVTKRFGCVLRNLMHSLMHIH